MRVGHPMDVHWTGGLERTVGQASLVPRVLVGGQKKAWYSLFAHARNYPLLDTWLGGEWVMLIHVIYSVTYYFSKYTSIVACSESETTTLQLALHHPDSL